MHTMQEGGLPASTIYQGASFQARAAVYESFASLTANLRTLEKRTPKRAYDRGP